MFFHKTSLRSWGAIFAFAAAASAQPIPGRYIVELEGAPAAEVHARVLGTVRGATNFDAASHPSVVARRAAIAASQSRFRAVVQARGGRVRASMDTVLNALVINADEALANQLRRMPGVLSVVQDRRFHVKVNRAAVLSGLPAAIEKVGGLSKAGAGIGVAILDTGVDNANPALQDDTLPLLEGYPKMSDGNDKYVSKKVVAARSYEVLADDKDYGPDAGDRNGHGTNAACAAACAPSSFPLVGDFMGFGPKAYLGNYKVIGDDGSAADSVVIKGIDDAVKDGFPILNLSLGSELTGDPADDMQAKAVNTAADAGAVIFIAAGNEGADGGGLNVNSIDSPGHADKAVTVGSSSNDRALTLEGAGAPLDPNGISGFSSRGPSRSNNLKPDMVAVGDNIFLADSTLKANATGVTITQGTSFATPSVAGAAATVMSFRPGLTSAQYRSLLVNSSTLLRDIEGKAQPVRYQGAGRLNLPAALDMLVTAEPTSLNFGRGSGAPDVAREVTLTNLGKDPVTISNSIESYDGRLGPTIAADVPATLAAGATGKFALKFAGMGLTGEYQGAIVISNATNNAATRIPYWYGVDSKVPAGFTFFKLPGSPQKSGAEVQFYGRVVDSSGIDISGVEFTVEPTEGGGSFVSAEFSKELPGIFAVTLKTGASGTNVFTFKAGNASRKLEITVE